LTLSQRLQETHQEMR